MIGVPTEPQSADWRARQREFAVAEIKAIARRQIGEDGAIALSMGRIAREMGLTPPALYRYFPSRNALVNALVLDAYRDLSRETAQSLVGVPDDAVGTRFERMVTAYRYWAIARPQEYVLIHGALFHSYRAPVVEIVEAGMQMIGHYFTPSDLVGVLDKLGLSTGDAAGMEALLGALLPSDGGGLDVGAAKRQLAQRYHLAWWWQRWRQKPLLRA